MTRHACLFSTPTAHCHGAQPSGPGCRHNLLVLLVETPPVGRRPCFGLVNNNYENWFKILTFTWFFSNVECRAFPHQDLSRNSLRVRFSFFKTEPIAFLSTPRVCGVHRVHQPQARHRNS